MSVSAVRCVCACLWVYSVSCVHACLHVCLSAVVYACVSACLRVSAVRCEGACLCVLSEVCACVSACVSSECVRACVCLADCALTPCPLGLRRPWLLAWPGQLCPWPSPSLPAQMRRGCAGTGVADNWTGHETGLRCWARLPPPHSTPVPRGSAHLSPLPLAGRGLSPVFDPVASGRPRECHLPAGVTAPPRAGRIHCGPSAIPSSCASARGWRGARRVGFSRAAVHSRNPLQPGLVSPGCTLRRWAHPCDERL